MRFYKDIIPKYEDNVMVIVTGHNQEIGVYCNLLEYDNIPAIILNEQISKWKINYDKEFPIGKTLPCMIYIIDKEKEYINLSYKGVSKESIKTITGEYNDKLHIYKIFEELNHFTQNTNINNEYIQNMIWDCLEFIKNKEDHEYDYSQYYKLLLDNPDILFSYDYAELFTEEIKNNILDSFNKRITKTDMTLEIKFSLKLFENGFVEKINKICDITLEDKDEILSVSSPIYRIVINSKTLDDAKNKTDKYLEEIKKNTNSYNVEFEADINNIKILKDRFFSLSYLNPN